MNSLIVLAFVQAAFAASLRNNYAEKCCPELGCYNDNPPFDHFPLPSCPEELGPTYSLYTRETGDSYQRITRTTVPPAFKASRRTIFIVHGWLGSKDWLNWMYEMRDSFMSKHDFNIVVVDWTGGSVDIWYPKAASDTRTIGGDAYLIMNNLVVQGGASWDNMYCIGHSLGAHVCGFLGKHTGGRIQRITGLDPAGPWFHDSPPEARLDKSDAIFQDNVHSDGNRVLLPLGIGKDIGHVDFFPNGNRVMPGCVTYFNGLLTKSVANPKGIVDIVSCSHHRSIRYYTESITSKCKFKSSPCSSNEDADKGRCNGCTGDQCQFLGYEAEMHPGRGIYYVKTNEDSPYCRGG